MKKPFWKPKTLIKGIFGNGFRNSLKTVTQELSFKLNRLCIQVDGIALGSPLGAIFGNICFFIVKKIGLMNILFNLHKLFTNFFIRYMDGIDLGSPLSAIFGNVFFFSSCRKLV